MGLKTYSVRLEEEVYEKVKGFLGEYGDPDLNIGFILRAYMRDLVDTLPDLKKSSFGLKNALSFWSSAFRQMSRTVDIEDILKGKFLVEKTGGEKIPKEGVENG